MKRSRPVEHRRRLRSGRRILVNKGVKKKSKRTPYAVVTKLSRPFDGVEYVYSWHDDKDKAEKFADSFRKEGIPTKVTNNVSRKFSFGKVRRSRPLDGAALDRWITSSPYDDEREYIEELKAEDPEAYKKYMADKKAAEQDYNAYLKEEYEKGKRKRKRSSTKIVKNDFGEYVVELYEDGNHVKDADYFTDDEDDAKETAEDMLKRKAFRRRSMFDDGGLYAALEEAANEGRITCPECGNYLEPDGPRCGDCGWKNPIVENDMI